MCGTPWRETYQVGLARNTARAGSQTVGDDQKKRPALSMTEQISCWPVAVYPTDPGGPQIWPGETPFGAGTALIVVGVGAIVAGSVPTVVGADDAGLTVVGGVVVVVGTSLAGTVTTEVKIDVEVVGASGVAGSTGAAVVRVVGTRTIGVALATVAGGTVSTVVVVRTVVVVVVDSAVTVVANTTAIAVGALVTTTADDDVVDIAAAIGWE
jgi:hypothetical protein